MFLNCTSINFNTVPIEFFDYNYNIESLESCFENCSGLITVPEVFKIPQSVKNITKIFANCKNLSNY